MSVEGAAGAGKLIKAPTIVAVAAATAPNQMNKNMYLASFILVTSSNKRKFAANTGESVADKINLNGHYRIIS